MPLIGLNQNCNLTNATYEKYCCPEDLFGQISDVVFYKLDYYATLINALTAAGNNQAQIETAWNTALANGKLIIMTDVAASYDGGSPKMGEPFGSRPAQVETIEHKINIKDRRVKNNVTFVNAVKKMKGYGIAFKTENLIWFAGNAEVSVTPKTPIAIGHRVAIRNEYEVMWTLLDHPDHWIAPAGIFVCATPSLSYVQRNNNTLTFRLDLDTICSGGGQVAYNSVNNSVNGDVTSDFFGPLTISFINNGDSVVFLNITSSQPLEIPSTYTFNITLSGCGFANPINLTASGTVS